MITLENSCLGCFQFYVLDKGWVGADELIEGDKVLIYGGKYAAVELVVLEQLSAPVTVYNF